MDGISDYIKKIKLFLFDMDGTLWLGDRLFDWTADLLDTIKKTGGKYLFMTNNSSRSVEDYVKKAEKLGIKAGKDDFITSSQVTAEYLRGQYKGSKLYVCGTESLITEFKKYGFEVTKNADEAECIVMGNDTELTFGKLDDVSRILSQKNIPYIATNPDKVCPTEYGYVPDCGSVCDMIFNATGKRPVFIGKPEPEMPLAAMRMTGFGKNETAVVGDRIYTDIKSGLNAGIKTVLVMSGETTEEILAASPDKPDVVLKDCGEILKILTLQ